MTQQHEYRKPLPQPSDVSREFWAGLQEREVRLPRCRQCEKFVFYPRTICPYCMGVEFDWVKVSGIGKVYSFTVVRRAMIPAFQEATPYVLALVQLEEGPRLTTNIVNCDVGNVRVDMPVQATYDDVTAEITLLKFEPA